MRCAQQGHIAMNAYQRAMDRAAYPPGVGEPNRPAIDVHGDALGRPGPHLLDPENRDEALAYVARRYGRE
jgi:hypothetical protein